MKVTAILPNELVEGVQRAAKGRTITESLLIALSEWLAQKRIQELNRSVAKQPLDFTSTAAALRKINRR